MPDNDFIKVYRNIFPLVKRHLDMLILRHWDKKIEKSKNIINKSGIKFYSQNDEDGILMEILNRLKIKKGNFLEIGVCGLNSNNGTENNTIMILHRSPPIEGTGETRFVFVIDPIFDPENEV